jgi:hypothetical protein
MYGMYYYTIIGNKQECMKRVRCNFPEEFSIWHAMYLAKADRVVPPIAGRHKPSKQTVVSRLLTSC